MGLGRAQKSLQLHLAPWQSLNVDQQGIDKVTLTIRKCYEGPLTGPQVKLVQSFPCHHGGNSFPKQFMDLIPIVRNHTALDDRTAIEDKNFRKNHKASILANSNKWSKTHWKSYIHRCRWDINSTRILISKLQELNVQLLGIETLSRVQGNIKESNV